MLGVRQPITENICSYCGSVSSKLRCDNCGAPRVKTKTNKLMPSPIESVIEQPKSWTGSGVMK
jgi:hypothetical protein